MTAQYDATVNLDLIGHIFTAIGQQNQPVPWWEFAREYPDEDMVAYARAFFRHSRRVVVQADHLATGDGVKEDSESAAGPPAEAAYVEGVSVKPRVKELADKIRDSGGWKLVVERYKIDRLVVKAAVAKAVHNSEDIKEAIMDLIEKIGSLL